MYLNDSKQLIFSPSDLTTFIDSPFASWMERARIEDKNFTVEPDDADPLMEMLADKGMKHESNYLDMLKQQGFSTIDITTVDKNDPVSATLEAMQQGFDIIYQATLNFKPSYGHGFNYCIQGHADFLKKVPIPSNLGDYSYEVWDAKLSSHVKPYFIIQLCSYAQMLEHAQGVRPKDIAIILGNNEEVRFSTNDFFFYYRSKLLNLWFVQCF